MLSKYVAAIRAWEEKEKKVFCSFHPLNICVYNTYMIFSSDAQNWADETVEKKIGKNYDIESYFYIDLYL